MAIEDPEYQLALASHTLLGELILKLMRSGALEVAAATQVFDDTHAELLLGSGGKNGAAVEMVAAIRSKVGL